MEVALFTPVVLVYSRLGRYWPPLLGGALALLVMLLPLNLIRLMGDTVGSKAATSPVAAGVGPDDFSELAIAALQRRIAV